ncbi:MAG: sulfatase/phosphatase domain-containing protein [Bryobacteraceae bacterium]
MTHTVELLDVNPTLADICGLRGAAPVLHGRSLAPLLRDRAAPWTRPAVTQVRRTRKSGSVMGYPLRTERLGYTMWDGGRLGEELYDCQRDPRELDNLAQSSAAAELKEKLWEALQQVLLEPGPCVALSGWLRQQGGPTNSAKTPLPQSTRFRRR